MIRAIIQAAFAVFFVSSVWAEELPRPRAGCIVLEDVLAKVGNAGAPMPEQIVRLPEHPYMVFLIYVLFVSSFTSSFVIQGQNRVRDRPKKPNDFNAPYIPHLWQKILIYQRECYSLQAYHSF